MIAVRPARPADAIAIGAVHVAAWRNTYPSLLPGKFLANLSVSRQAAHYDRAIRAGEVVLVAVASAEDVPQGGGARIVGFCTAARSPDPGPDGRRLGDGEIATLYVLDDWRDRGIGRRLLSGAAQALAERGCATAFLWVLRDNPSRWFCERMGGKAAAESTTRVAGTDVPQTAYAWDPIAAMLARSEGTA